VHSWIVGLAANAVITLAYLSVAAFIVVPLVRSRQLGRHKLGAATAAVFSTCALHHGVHAVDLLLPSVGVDVARGHAVRAAWGWDLALWDVVMAAVAVAYVGLRRTYGSLMQGARLLDELKRRERQALEINDNVLQGLVVAKMALELGQRDKAVAALDTSIASASRMISSLLDSDEHPVAAGLLRTNAAVLDAPDPSSAGPRTPLGHS
jgi:signal transduction histidine kinase